MLIIDSIICKKWGHVSFTFADLFFIFITFALNVVKEFIDFYLKNCYDIEEVKNEVKDIINQHEKILNTLGEKDKEEYIIKVAK